MLFLVVDYDGPLFKNPMPILFVAGSLHSRAHSPSDFICKVDEWSGIVGDHALLSPLRSAECHTATSENYPAVSAMRVS